MGLKSCSRCAGWANSPAETLKFLKGEEETCPDCPRKATIEVVSRQFRSKCSSWWVVKGHVAVPVWIKEYLQTGYNRIGEWARQKIQ